MATYRVNKRGVAKARELIDAQQYTGAQPVGGRPTACGRPERLPQDPRLE